jgi:hypothetical protein
MFSLCTLTRFESFDIITPHFAVPLFANPVIVESQPNAFQGFSQLSAQLIGSN